ncbi:MAG: hypothetical protein ACYSUM_24465 [Planctomycetota bacterium]|jgi:hypothetical protein
MAKPKRSGRRAGKKQRAETPGTADPADVRPLVRASTEPDLVERNGIPRAPLVVNAFGRTPEEAEANLARAVASVPGIIEGLARMPHDPNSPLTPATMLAPLAAAGSKHVLARVAAAVKVKRAPRRVDPDDLRACFAAQREKARDTNKTELDRRAAIDYAKQIGHELGPDPEDPKWPRGGSPASVKRARTKKRR